MLRLLFAVVLVLSTVSVQAAVSVAENLRFLEGVWSAECSKAHMVFFRRDGQLFQRGFLIIGDFSLRAGEMVPTTPVAVKRRGDRMIVTTRSMLNGEAIANIGHFDNLSQDRMRLVRLVACAGENCRETRLAKVLHRCDANRP